MKHLKTYTKLFESKLNPIEEYIQSFIDLGFVLDNSGGIGVTELNLEKKLDSDTLSEIFNEYLTLIERLKEIYKLNSYNISFSDSGVTIKLTRFIKDLQEEFQMTEAQKTAYDAILSTLKEGESLRVSSIDEHSISFVKCINTYCMGFVDIHDSGKVRLPILRGSKSRRVTEPFTAEDVNWFERIIWIDDNYKSSTIKEFDILHSKSQQELREIYK